MMMMKQQEALQQRLQKDQTMVEAPARTQGATLIKVLLLSLGASRAASSRYTSSATATATVAVWVSDTAVVHVAGAGMDTVGGMDTDMDMGKVQDCCYDWGKDMH